MVTIIQAEKKIRNELGDCSITKIVEYKNLYLAVAITTDQAEGFMDSLYYVDRHTGSFGVYPYLTEEFDSVMFALSKEVVL